MSQAQLDALFRASPAGVIPQGTANGTALVAPGIPLNETIATLIGRIAWQGKVFDAASGTLRNRVTPFGLNAVAAQVYKAPSLLDGLECIVLDYSQTSFVARRIRDEIRAVEPGLYLGKVYWNRTRLMDFALEVPEMQAAPRDVPERFAAGSSSPGGPKV
jgi:hypothetical protein